MKIKIYSAAILLFLCSAQIIFAQEKVISGGIINGRAIELPKPDYPQEAKDFCASGQVQVEVLIDENGDVVSAKAISGNEVLQESALEAAKKAKFSTNHFRVKVEGIIVYNFVPEKKCIVVGIVNKRARILPKPKIANLNKPKHLQIKEEQIVAVQIVVDMNGKVVKAKAISGHLLLRAAYEYAARQAEFAPTLINGGSPFNMKALLIYKFKTDGTIDTDIEKDDKDVVGTPVDLVKPPPPFCNCRFGGNSSVLVEAKIDELGNVIKATAITGHPILKLTSEKAALESKFLPTNIKAKIMIQYSFIETGKWSVEISNVEVKEIKIEK